MANSTLKPTREIDAEQRLREKLRKIEALFAGAATAGEKAAAGAAAERIRRQFSETKSREKVEEFKFSISDPWSRQLFTALCRRYGLRPFRYTRMHRQTVMVHAPASFVNNTLWPEFQELSDALSAHLMIITERIIREEVFATTGEADEIPEPARLR
ncbi:hypothetical protein RN629_15885 [Sphingomonadaceae bacterium jetA1]|uniref:hypothetical protein n=1 Tax=Sphingomonadaceae TaxID=41297 RepID=UPI001F0B437B|nr:hypothetical protein [Novosphingobium sp. PC22D]